MEANISPRYTQFAVVLHWAIALLIVLNFGLAWSAEDLPKPDKMAVMANHKAVGLTILALTVLRIVWRLIHKAPEFSSALAAWEVALARVTHALFYVLMLFIPLTGWGMVSLGGNPVDWFGVFSVPALPVGSDKALGGVLNESHEVLAIAMLVLFLLHVAGALKHQLVDRDDTMARMLPFLRR